MYNVRVGTGKIVIAIAVISMQNQNVGYNLENLLMANSCCLHPCKGHKNDKPLIIKKISTPNPHTKSERNDPQANENDNHDHV